MADSLVLRGVKDVREHTGSEMVMSLPTRGGDTHMIKRWWTPSGSNTVYVPCTVFDVTNAAGTTKLAVASTPSSTLKVSHDGSFGFTLSDYSEISNVALFTDAYSLIESYEINANPGVALKTTAGSGVRPTNIGTVTISGAPATLGTNTNSGNITANISGTAGNLTYTWTKVSGSGTATFSAGSAKTTLVQFNAADTYVIRCSVASSDAGLTGGSPKTGDSGNIVVS